MGMVRKKRLRPPFVAVQYVVLFCFVCRTGTHFNAWTLMLYHVYIRYECFAVAAVTQCMRSSHSFVTPSSLLRHALRKFQR